MSEDSPLLRNLNLRDDRFLEARPLVEEALGLRLPEANREHNPYAAPLTEIHKFVHVQSVSLLIRRGTDEMLVLQSLTDAESSDLLKEEHPANESFSGAALHERKTQLANDIVADPRKHQRVWRWWCDKLRPNLLQHGVFVPIAGDLEFRGVLRFFNRLLPDGSLSPIGFTEHDRDVLEFLANIAAVQFNKIRLADRLTITSQSISSLHGRSTIEDVAQEVAHTGVRLADAAAAAVFLLDPKREDSLKLYGSYGFKRSYDNLSIPINKSLLGSVVQSGKPLEIKDLQAASGASSSGPGKTEGMASYLALPVGANIGDDARKIQSPGVLVVYARFRREFGASTVNLLQQFALSGGTVIENHRRAEESSELRRALPQVAHSVRTPLGRVWGALEEIEEISQSRELSDRLKDAWDNLKLADARLEDMLWSKPGLLGVTGMVRQRINLYNLVETCKNRLERFAKRRKTTIDLRRFSGNPEIHADPDKLDILFDNLIENAIKYSWRNKIIVISGEERRGDVRVSIVDKGLGIPEEMREKIFERSARSNVLDRQRSIRGTGLGLYLSKLIVEAHGGEITFKSIPFLDDPERQRAYEGYETTFIVTLPKEESA
jgi:signal transduction histidine kinase